MRIAVVAAVRLYREGLADALTGKPGVEVVGTASNAPQAALLLAAAKPALAIVDIALVGADLIAKFADACPRTRIIALGVGDDAPQIIACAELGVVAYVLPDASLDELVGVLQDVERGEVRCTPVVAATLMRRVAELAGVARCWESGGDELTPREREIADLIELGLMNKEIARRLGLSLFTVKNHVHNVLDKLNLSRRSEVARWYRADTAARSSPLC